MAFVARPRSKAAGADSENASVFDSVLNLKSTCNFGADATDHSGQFQRPIQSLTRFYNHLLNELPP